jgi:hypothetical protein
LLFLGTGYDNVAAASHAHAHAAGATVTRTARVLTFDNLGDDSSPDVRKTPSLERTAEKRVSLLPSVSGGFLRFSFVIFTAGPNNWFCRSYPACTFIA